MFLYGYVIPILLTFLPWILVRYVFVTPESRKLTYRESAPYLLPTAAVWVASVYLPRPWLFGGATDSFPMHFLGGVVAGLLFVYAMRAYRLRLALWWQLPLFLYFFVSGMGVLNELYEFAAFKAGILEDPGIDTWWDLVANTCGGLAVLIGVYLSRLFRSSR